MPTDGFYIDDVEYTDTFEWKYTVSVGQFNDYFEAIVDNTSGAMFVAGSYFSDIKIYSGSGTLAFRGRIDNIKTVMNGDYGNAAILTGYGYVKELMDRFAIETYTSKSRSFMVDDMVQTYSDNITTGGITVTSESLDRIIKSRSAYEAISNLASEIDYDIWVDNDNDFIFKEKGIVASGQSIDYDTDDIGAVDIPNEGTTMYNAVYVYGDPDTTGTIAYAENPTSIALYGITKEFPPVYDRSLKTVDECQQRAFGIVNNNSTIVPVITIKTIGYESLTPGETVILSNFDTDFSVSDGNYVVLERSQSLSPGFTVLKVAKYNDSTEDVVIDIIKRLRRIEYQELDQAQTVTKFLRVNEDLELEGYTIEVWVESLAESFIAGHSTNGKAGMQSTQIYAGLSGMTTSKPGDGTRT